MGFSHGQVVVVEEHVHVRKCVDELFEIFWLVDLLELHLHPLGCVEETQLVALEKMLLLLDLLHLSAGSLSARGPLDEVDALALVCYRKS